MSPQVLLEDFSINLFIAAVLSAIGMVGMALIRQVLVYAGRRAMVELERSIEQQQRRHDALLKEHEQVQARVRTAEDERRMVQVQIAEARRRLQTAAQDNYEVIHEMGEPGEGRRLFLGSLVLGSTLMINKTVSTPSLLKGVRHVLEVWAESQADAVRIARQAFPTDAGFSVSNLQPAGLQAAPAAAAQ